MNDSMPRDLTSDELAMSLSLSGSLGGAGGDTAPLRTPPGTQLLIEQLDLAQLDLTQLNLAGAVRAPATPSAGPNETVR